MPKYIDTEKLQLEPEPIDNVMNGVLMLGNGRAFGKTVRMISEALKSMIDNAPAEDVAPVVHAQWIKTDRGMKCSNPKCACLSSFWDGCLKSPFCPWCGATMDGERREGE